MRILALDLGTQTGWACRTAAGQITHGTIGFRPGRYEGGGMRYLRFRQWLVELLEAAPPDVVYFEEVRRHKGTDAAHVYGGMLAHLTTECEHRKVPYCGVPVGTIKRHCTGNGNANKQAMMARLRGKRFEPADDNEADAIALLLWAVEQHAEAA